MQTIINIILLISIILILIYICAKKIIIENFNSYHLPKTIYLYWHDATNPFVLENINCWKRNIPKEWTIEFVNDSNINEYVSKEFTEKYKDLDRTKFSDFLRLELLYEYGGVWMDAFIFITNGKFLDDFREEMLKNEYDATLFNFSSKNTKTTVYLENWWIMTPPHSNLISDMRTEFNKSYEMGFLNYKKNILLPSGIDLSNTIGYEDDIYLMQHAIIHYLVHSGKVYKINIKNASESMFKIHDMFNWDHYQVANYLSENNNWKNDVYAVKMIGATRKVFQGKEDKLIEIMKKI